MNKIAAAHEKDLIKHGCVLKITVDYKNISDDINNSTVSPDIKLQLIHEGKSKDVEIGEFYQPDAPAFI